MRTIYTPSSIDEHIEEKLWESGIIVFDTCALLDFYHMKLEFQEIISDILNSLKDKIWLPAQVVSEYNKNRENAISQPIKEKYEAKSIENNNLVKDLKSYVSKWEEQYYHPYISEDKLKLIKDAIKVIEPQIKEIKTTINIEYQERKREIKNILGNDKLSNTVNSLTHGNPFLFSEIKEIVKEGQIRYANQIPPGYMDVEKPGIHKYGDLIIWKEILRYAKFEKKDVIFISNDVKEDWIIVDASKEKGKPRRELLTEFEEETGRIIWFYKTVDFIEKLETIYEPKQAVIPFYGKLGIVRDILKQAERDRNLKRNYSDDFLQIICEGCDNVFKLNVGELNFEWNGVSSFERSMGGESEYESCEMCNCPNCGNQIDLKLKVWEYPVGAFNMQDIEIDGGKIEESIDLSQYISFDDDNYDDFDECSRCDDRSVLDNMNLCESCRADYNRFINSEN